MLFVTIFIGGCKDGNPFKTQSHLSIAQAQAAVSVAMDGAASQLHFAKGYKAIVEGVQENLPANVATADVLFEATHFHCNMNIFVNFEQRWMRGVAQFKRYSDGRWVLTSIQPTQQADSLDCIAHWDGSVDVNGATEAGRITAINGIQGTKPDADKGQAGVSYLVPTQRTDSPVPDLTVSTSYSVAVTEKGRVYSAQLMGEGNGRQLGRAELSGYLTINVNNPGDLMNILCPSGYQNTATTATYGTKYSHDLDLGTSVEIEPGKQRSITVSCAKK